MGALPALVGAYCVGVGSVGGLTDLTPHDLLRLSEIADQLHRAAAYPIPPDPLLLAALEGVRLHRLPASEAQVERLGLDMAWFPVSRDRGEQGLLIAHVLAGLILRRRGLPHREPDAWALAALLVAPAWLANRWPPGSPLPWCPRWLLALRRRVALLEEGEARGLVENLFAADLAAT